MKKYLSRALTLGLAAVLAYALFTPVGALRVMVALAGHPVSAVTMDVRKATAEDVHAKKLDVPDGVTVYHIQRNVPFDGQTAAKLENWAVKRYGVFYLAEYYGYL